MRKNDGLIGKLSYDEMDVLHTKHVGAVSQDKRKGSSQVSTGRKPIKSIQELMTEQLAAIRLTETTYTIEQLNLPEETLSRMYSHQQEGVAWMYRLYMNNMGGILGDDMGLGKTFQCICLLNGLIQQAAIKRIMILAPVAVLENWNRELQEHLIPHVKKVHIQVISSEMTKKNRSRVFEQLMLSRHPVIILTSYQLYSNMIEDFCIDDEDRPRSWDYVVLDEGHIIKNPSTKLSKAVHQIRAKHKLILTGTPMQNHLTEFWALIDWVTNGKVLGSKSHFTTKFADPIMKGQDPKATDIHRTIANQAVLELLSLIRPILLQRKKCEKEDILKLPSKIEVVMWIPLSSKQRKSYEEYLASRDLAKLLSQSTSPLFAITRLKTLCRHPFLIETSEVMKRKKLGKISDDDDLENDPYNNEDVDELNQTLRDLTLDKSYAKKEIHENSIMGSSHVSATSNVFEIAGRKPDEFEILQGSVKLRVLLKLTKRLFKNNHRILIFSQSKLMLDIIEELLDGHDMPAYRIDGSSNSRDRQHIIDQFNQGASTEARDNGYSQPDICLLTTKACGYGINLTGADRVIIFDPSWNPAEDRQAVDRAYRIGQKNDVIVYRMIMAGSVEEKMYEKQVFKDGLRIITESGASSRYFSKDETKALFTIGPAGRSLVLEKLWERQGHEMKSPPEDIPCHDNFGGVLGYSRHDTLYAEVRPAEMRQPLSIIYDERADNQNTSNDDDDYKQPDFMDTKRDKLPPPMKPKNATSLFTGLTPILPSTSKSSGIQTQKEDSVQTIIDLTCDEVAQEDLLDDLDTSSMIQAMNRMSVKDYSTVSSELFEEQVLSSDSINEDDDIVIFPAAMKGKPKPRRIIDSDDEDEEITNQSEMLNKSNGRDNNHDIEDEHNVIRNRQEDYRVSSDPSSLDEIQRVDSSSRRASDEHRDNFHRSISNISEVLTSDANGATNLKPERLSIRVHTDPNACIPVTESIATPMRPHSQNALGSTRRPHTPFILVQDDSDTDEDDESDDNNDGNDEEDNYHAKISASYSQLTSSNLGSQASRKQSLNVAADVEVCDVAEDSGDVDVNAAAFSQLCPESIDVDEQELRLKLRRIVIDLDNMSGPIVDRGATNVCQIPCYLPRHRLQQSQIEQYKEILIRAEGLERDDSSMESIAEAYVQALRICDDDIQIHRKLQMIRLHNRCYGEPSSKTRK